MHPGDLGKLVVAALCLVFLALLALHERGWTALFSKSYLEDGFCLTNRDRVSEAGGVRWDHGHLLAFYADAGCSLLMGVLVHLGRTKLAMTEPALRPVSKNMISLLGHGCGHLFLGLRSSTVGGAGRVFEDMTPISRAFAFILLAPVWYAFMRDKKRSPEVAVCFATFHNALQVFFVPTRFFFTHVLIAVLFGSAIRWLRSPAEQKTRFYAYETWLVDVPILLMTFTEAITCDSFLIHYGGHVWFDMVVPIGFLVYWTLLVLEGGFMPFKCATLHQVRKVMRSALGSSASHASNKSAESLVAVSRKASMKPGRETRAMRLLRQASGGIVCLKED